MYEATLKFLQGACNVVWMGAVLFLLHRIGAFLYVIKRNIEEQEKDINSRMYFKKRVAKFRFEAGFYGGTVQDFADYAQLLHAKNCGRTIVVAKTYAKVLEVFLIEDELHVRCSRIDDPTKETLPPLKI